MKKYTATALLVFANIIVIGSLLFFMTRTDNQSTNVSKDLTQIKTLMIQNQEMQDKIADAERLTSLDQNAQALALVPASKIVYINDTNSFSYNFASH